MIFFLVFFHKKISTVKALNMSFLKKIMVRDFGEKFPIKQGKASVFSTRRLIVSLWINNCKYSHTVMSS